MPAGVKMAAGRGELMESILKCVRRKDQANATRRGRGRGTDTGTGDQPGPHRGAAAEGGGGRRPKKKTKRKKKPPPLRPAAGHSSAGQIGDFNVKTQVEHEAVGGVSGSLESKQNLLESLPTEILIRILSFLDAPSLFCVSHVSRLLHQLANDNVVWQKIYESEFRSHLWDLKVKEEPWTERGSVEDHSVERLTDQLLNQSLDQSEGHWKRMFFRTLAGQEMKKWRKELQDTSPYTGLPRQTDWVLRNLNVCWELTLSNRYGSEVWVHQSSPHFFESSVIVCWTGLRFSDYRHITRVQVHGVRREAFKSSRIRPEWRSLILDTKTMRPQFLGKDPLIELHLLTPEIFVGIWRGQIRGAFLMMSLHFHRLVEKSLLGSPACPYLEAVDRPPSSSDPELGLHGYSLHFVLHNLGSEIMSGHFRQLSCSSAQIRSGFLKLTAIHLDDPSRHRALSGSMKLTWRSSSLEGSVKNCCFMTSTLLDVYHKPFWCVSSPVWIRMSRGWTWARGGTRSWTSEYGGENFLMEHRDQQGKVSMQLVWLKEEEQFFLVSLTVYVSVEKVNKHFGRSY